MKAYTVSARNTQNGFMFDTLIHAKNAKDCYKRFFMSYDMSFYIVKILQFPKKIKYHDYPSE